MENNRPLNDGSNSTENNIRNVMRNIFYNETNHESNANRTTTDIEVISDLIYEYTHNIRDYNTNIRSIISLIENHQTRINQPSPAPVVAPRPRRSRNDTTTRTDPLRNNLFMSFFSAIPINQDVGLTTEPNPLTREEIARSTITYGFILSERNPDASGNVCPISLEHFQEGDVICEIRGCRHKFKRPLLMNWLRRNSRCPVCRYELRSYVDAASNEDVPTEPGDDSNPFDETANANANTNTNTNVSFQTPERQISDAFSNIMNAFLQNPNLDASGNLLYEFQFPLNR